ncbi:hypothetical protein NDU88_006471 [Pleurodeles waltl]|uniref:Uncharacterized protein n=1 Tax=Pleurodeles waltl TaxID=8319 RepID=A0AAV7QLD8_PLEWA|nr:hypothetical protein NDU88_006471 [Pleurodeles waltl]
MPPVGALALLGPVWGGDGGPQARGRGARGAHQNVLAACVDGPAILGQCGLAGRTPRSPIAVPGGSHLSLGSCAASATAPPGPPHGARARFRFGPTPDWGAEAAEPGSSCSRAARTSARSQRPSSRARCRNLEAPRVCSEPPEGSRWSHVRRLLFIETEASCGGFLFGPRVELCFMQPFWPPCWPLPCAIIF